jgi:DNA repair photolyase
MIGTGGMSDPYIPIEKDLGLTRRCLELIDEYGYGLAIQTKSDLILRDLDILKSINRKTKCIVQITMTTYYEDLCGILEPNVCTTARRFEVLETMREEGIPTVCWMTPILPFINDTEENIRGLLDYCIRAKVYGILQFGVGVTLREGDREYFYRKLDEHFPGMKQRYIRNFGNAYEIPSPREKALTEIITEESEAHGIIYNAHRIFDYMRLFEDRGEGEQLSFF